MNIDEMLDEIFDKVDTACHAGEWEKINNWLKNVDTNDESKDNLSLLFSWIIITRPAKEHLLYRPEFHAKVTKIFTKTKSKQVLSAMENLK